MIHQETIPPPKEHSTNNESMENISKHAEQRHWIIIEDYPSKAEYLIAHILNEFPDDIIHLLHSEKDMFNIPIFLKVKERGNPKSFNLRIKENIGSRSKVIAGAAYYYDCHNHELFLEAINKMMLFEKAIMLLDVELTALGGKQGFDSLVRFKAREFLKDQDKKATITITTNQASVQAVKADIIYEEKRINENAWLFRGSTMNENCKSAVIESNKHWQRLHGNPVFSIQEFFEEMSKFKQHDCHNWQDEIPNKIDHYVEKGRWNTEWNMPIQLSYLIQFLKYDPEDFIKEFGLKNENDFFKDGHAICECLKVLGTTDGNTLGFSILGALLISWAAYREVFLEGSNNQAFIAAIKSCHEKDARNAMVTPPQSTTTQKETAVALYEMIKVLCISTEKRIAGTDNIKSVKLTTKALEIRFGINPENLQKTMDRELKKRYSHSSIGGGSSSKKIVDYFVASNKCDRLIMNKFSFLGNAHKGFSLLTAGYHPSNGIILKIGYETTV